MVNQRQTILWVNIFLLFASILCKSKHLDDFMVHIGNQSYGHGRPSKIDRNSRCCGSCCSAFLWLFGGRRVKWWTILVPQKVFGFRPRLQKGELKGGAGGFQELNFFQAFEAHSGGS